VFVPVVCVNDCLVDHHLSPQPGVAGNQAGKLAVVDISPVHPETEGQGAKEVRGGAATATERDLADKNAIYPDARLKGVTA
jgi:hypothetical protein